MPEIITLQNGDSQASIATAGAWLLALHDASGPVLFPRQDFESGGKFKQRGGCHVCLPNFGPGGDSGQPQHGYGRLVQWNIAEQSSTTATLTCQGTDGYESLHSSLEYRLLSGGVQMQLDITNRANRPLRVSPGFHPYFLAENADAVTVNETSYELSQLSDAKKLSEIPDRMLVGSAKYSLGSINLPQWVLWSDRLGDYVCVEPTLKSDSFASGTAPLLQPGETSLYAFSLQRAEQ